ncbi:hypothetical protein J6590_076790 [Homalodisca vitripennis]|nr:hypothetical protein J6590_076790 [Homalodisca vitripennis]
MSQCEYQYVSAFLPPSSLLTPSHNPFSFRGIQATDHLKAFGLSGRVAKTPSRGVQGPRDELFISCHLSIMRGRREPSLCALLRDGHHDGHNC